MIPFKNIDESWTLFLDRDGVINQEKHNGYINSWDEFVFYDGVKESISKLSSIFGRIIVITNQRGVGRGITSSDTLYTIHENMCKEIEHTGGKIDAVFFCSDVADDSPNRKPNPGMGHQAKAMFPEIDFSKTIMIGNSPGDMGFGRNLKCYTVFLTTTRKDFDHQDSRIDQVFSSLSEFTKSLRQHSR